MNIADRFAHLSPLKRALLAVETMQAKLEAMQRAKTEAIAIIGMGCRFPGGVDDPDSYWRLLRDGVDAITETPPTRWDVEALYDGDPQAAGKMSTRWGGYLQDIDRFDPQFFGIAPREAAGMDPQQRMLLEVCWEALERAGQPPDRLAGTQTGVFVGIISSDYSQLYFRSEDPARIDSYFGTGTAMSIAAGRLSYVLGVHGPSLAIDTACSSSLVAVHLACQSLRAGECHLALAGGVNLILTPEGTIYFSQVGAMARDGRCKTFDAKADGFVRSDGCGMVVLKRLSDAVEAGDPILAVVRGSAVNQDGRSGGLTAPNGPAQQAVIKKALANAGVAPARVSYVEAHGTGTALGDPMEVQALGAVMRVDRPNERPLAIGSVKTNIGHTEAAAGIAGLMKVVLMLEHRQIPPHLHFDQPSPHILWDDWPVTVRTVATPWLSDDDRRVAGVSSFGFSGTNAHVVLEEAPPRIGAQRRGALPHGLPLVLPLSARSEEALKALAAAYRAWLTDAAPSEAPSEATSVAPSVAAQLADVCYTAAVRRSHYEYRLAVVGDTAEALAAGLEAYGQGTATPDLARGAAFPGHSRRVVFVFPGQGGQWRGMARDLLATEPVFRAAVDACAQAFATEVSWSLLDVLTRDESAAETIDVLQPTLFAIQVGLAALWRAWGLTPAAVVGHSMGEVAAAHVAGILSLEEAAQIICRRSALLMRLRGQGAMAVVELSPDEAAAAIAEHATELAVAVSNGPRSTVLSGAPAALRSVLARLEARGVFCRWVNVDVASHSPQMDVLRGDLLSALAAVTPQAGAIPFVSTVTGAVCAGPELDAAYWMRNLRDQVRFWPAVEQLRQEGHDVFVELSPHPTLVPALQEAIATPGTSPVIVPSLRRDEPSHTGLLRALGALYCAGCTIDWRGYYPGGDVVALPLYPWQRDRYWLDEAPEARAHPRRIAASQHPLAGEHIELASPAGTHCWRFDLDVRRVPFLADHRVRTAVVLPAAAYLEMLLGAAEELFGGGAPVVEQMQFQQALLIPKGDDGVDVQLLTSATVPGTVTFEFLSRAAAGPGSDRPWTLHAAGTMTSARTTAATQLDPLEAIRARCQDYVSGSEHYQALAQRGLEYGPGFQGVVDVWRRSGEAVGKIQLPSTGQSSSQRYHVHPVLLDAAFQTLAATLPDRSDECSYLPVGLGAFRQLAPAAGELWACARLRSHLAADQDLPDVLEGDVWLVSAAGDVLVEATGLQLRRFDGPSAEARSKVDEWLFDLEWEAQPLPAPEHDTSVGADSVADSFADGGADVGTDVGRWVIFADARGIGSALAARLEGSGDAVVRVERASSYLKTSSTAYQLDPARPEDYRLLLHELNADGGAARGIVHLWSVDAGGDRFNPINPINPTAVDEAQALGAGSVLQLVQALAQEGWRDAPRLWLVTAGVQAVGDAGAAVSIAQAPVWGMGRTIAHEHAELQCSCVDLGADLSADLSADGREVESLALEIRAAGREDQIVLRGDARYVARLERASATARGADRDSSRTLIPAGGRSFAVAIESPGILDRLTLRETARRAPGAGEVEIEVRAAGLNFLDVLSAMGLRPDATPGAQTALGGECAGTVVGIGEGVSDLQLGDAVVALASGAFRRHVTTAAMFVAHKPERLSFEAAAALPIACMTASYALREMGRLAAGERVLIHSAAGGVGLAAVQLAQRIGAEVFATAGNEEKRAFLRSIGVRHVIDSRSSAYVEEIRAHTGGSGVDLVLNSLTGDAIAHSLSVLAPYGRFVEIGKRDIYQNRPVGLGPFRKNLSYFAVDLARMIDERPDRIHALLAATMQDADTGALVPLRHRDYPVGRVADAFRDMAQARHIGKIVLRFDDPDVLIEPGADTAPAIKHDATYLITGGLGGLGLTIAQTIVSQGATHIVLVGRSEPTPAARDAIAAMEQAGARVVVAQADVARVEQMAPVLDHIAHDLPPLLGVVHAAGVLDDGLILQLTPERLRTVGVPKIHGAWNLHSLTAGLALDFFVMFSSAAAWLGSPGQSNYAAANAFLDALAASRRRDGLPALSINWGPWADVGLAAAQDNRGARLAFRGMTSLSPDQGADAFLQLLKYPRPHVAVMQLNLRQWRQFYPKVADLPLVEHLTRDEEWRSEQGGSTESPLRARLQTAEPAQRRGILEAYVREQLGAVLRLAPSRIDVRTPFRNLGIDSLMALELRNRLEVAANTTLSATLVWNYPTVTALVPFLAERIGVALEGTPASTESSSQDDGAAADTSDLDALGEDELATLLAQELDALEQAKSP